MAKERVSLFHLVLQIAVGCLLAVGGIWALQGGGDPAAVWIARNMGNLGKTLRIVFGVVELVVGILLILKFFIAGLSSLSKILMFIVVIIWAIVVVCGDILGGSGILQSKDFLSALYRLAMDVIILCGIIIIK